MHLATRTYPFRRRQPFDTPEESCLAAGEPACDAGQAENGDRRGS
jgi:hypothetical protein